MELENKNDLDQYENDGNCDAKESAEGSEHAYERVKHSHHGHHSHHSHHEHHRRHRHHRSSSSSKQNNKRKEAFEKFVRRNKKRLIYLAAALCFFVCLIIVGIVMDQHFAFSNKNQETGSDAGVVKPVDEVQIGVPFFDSEVVIVGPAVEALMNADPSVPVSQIYDQYKPLGTRLDVGLPVELSYKIVGIPDGYSVKSAEYLVADNSALQNPMVYHTDATGTTVSVYHLKTGTKYYYKINLTFNNGAEYSLSGSFKTAAGPRVLNVDGVYNLRDIGGWTLSDGRVVKQGLLFRGCEIDGAVESKYKITPEGINTMLTILGIKTDMDLRPSTDNKYGTNVLGAGVNHIYYAAPMYSNIFNSEENAQIVREIFSDLADQRNYPVYLHCTYGQDRTGTICYLLEGLLGVDEASIMKDYQLSGLHHGDVSNELMTDFVKKVKELPGYTLAEKVEGYLLSIGVTEEEIASIRRIFVEEQ